MDAMTPGIQKLIAEDAVVAKWAADAVRAMNGGIKHGGEKASVSMVVGRPGQEGQELEDEGRTLVLPLPWGKKTLYACKNETGGSTIMLASEY